MPPTLCGIIALAFWSMSAMVTVELREIPIFQMLSFNFFLGFLTACVWTTYRKQWKEVCAAPKSVWAAGVIAIFLNLFSYASAFKLAPAAQVDLIYYLWPLLTICMVSVLHGQDFSWKYLVGGILGITGVNILIFNEQPLLDFPEFSFLGYIYALIAALSWTTYILFSRRHPNIPPITIGLSCGIAALIALTAHRVCESPVSITSAQYGFLFVLGSCITGTSFVLWDYGVKKGNIRLLSVLSYLTPTCSVFFLVMRKHTEYSIYLLIATILVVIGSAFALVHEFETKSESLEENV